MPTGYRWQHILCKGMLFSYPPVVTAVKNNFTRRNRAGRMAVRCGINTDIRRHFSQKHQSHSSSAQPVCKDALQECTDAQGVCTDAAGERISGGRRRGKMEKTLGEE